MKLTFKSRSLAFLILAGVLSLPEAAEARNCPKGYYKNGFPPICLPKGGPVIQTFNPANQVKTSLRLGQKIVQGDIKGIAQATGELIARTQCAACKSVAEGNFSKGDVALAEELIGRGFLFYATNEPIFLIADVDSSTATQFKVKNESSTMSELGQLKHRDIKEFDFGVATCIVQTPKGDITAGWVDLPKGTEIATKIPLTYPKVKIWAGDIISVTAPHCPKQTIDKVQTSVTKATFKYQFSNILPGEEEQMTYFLGGKLVQAEK